MWKPRINPWNPSVVAGHAVACYKFKSAFVMNNKFFTITFLYLVTLKYFCMDKIASKTFTSNSSVWIPFWFKYACRNAEMNLKSTCWPGLIFNYILRTFVRISPRKIYHTFLIVKNTLSNRSVRAAIYIFSQLWQLWVLHGSLYHSEPFSRVWIDVIELTKLKSKEVDLPFPFKDTLSDCRWIEYWLRHALAFSFVSIQCITVLAWCAIWSWTCIQAYRRGGQAELR